MSTYICSFCLLFDLSPCHCQPISSEIPPDAKLSKNWFTNKGGTISEMHKEAIRKYRIGKPTTKGRPNPTAAQNARKGAANLSKTATGRKRKYLPDGSWTWEYKK